MYANSWGRTSISKEQIKAIRNSFRLNQKIRLIEQGSRRSKRYIRGRIITRTKYFITVMVSKNGIERYPESFKYVDFILGKVEIAV